MNHIIAEVVNGITYFGIMLIMKTIEREEEIEVVKLWLMMTGPYMIKDMMISK